tara:strand:+ start:487 stop:711 length:225 start_codon:yes stop_codon:yes gene_type:complete
MQVANNLKGKITLEICKKDGASIFLDLKKTKKHEIYNHILGICNDCSFFLNGICKCHEESISKKLIKKLDKYVR